MAYYSVDPEKHEHELYEHVKKAVLIEEKAPKQKHVRAVSAYTWIHKNSTQVWNSLKMLNLFSSDVQTFKALITIHYLLRDGHPNVLGEALKQKNFLESFKSYGNQGDSYGYGGLIRNYVDFLFIKLNLHAHHPKFTGNFGYKDVSVREFDYKSVASFETADLNDGYVTVEELMDLQQAVDGFQKSIFKNLPRGVNHNCRISALVPLVEESYGLYLFLTNMLQSLHRDREAWDALGPLRDRYRDQFWTLKKFYDEARKLPYLTSLIVVPRLPDKPPEFYILSEHPSYPKQQQQQPSSSNYGSLIGRDIVVEPPQLLLVNDDDDNSSLASLHRPASSTLLLEDALAQASTRNAELENALGHATQRCRAMEQELSSLRAALQEGQFSWDRLRQLENDLQELRSKYDKLAKAYATLNTEHQTLLKTHANCGELSSLLEAKRRELDALRRAKDTELAQARVQLDAQHALTDRLRRELSDAKARSEQLSSDKDDAVRALTAAREKAQGADREKDAHAQQQVAVLDAGLEESARRIRALSSQLADEKTLHRATRASVLQRTLEACMLRIRDTVCQLQDNTHVHPSMTSMAVTLATGEKVASVSATLLSALQVYLSRADVVSAVAEAPSFADQLVAFLIQVGGHAQQQEETEWIALAIQTGEHAMDYLQSAVPADGVALGDTVMRREGAFAGTLNQLMRAMEKTASMTSSDDVTVVDWAQRMEREMSEAAQAIELSAQRIAAMMATTVTPTMDAAQRAVHASILGAVMAMTTSIGQLIQAATAAQREIVAHGQGSQSAALFYKQNHRWTEGLISAAKMVAAATVLLVEVADGVVKGERSMEDLMAASKEVAAATAQLVAAARVKMVKGSRTQGPLEEASRAVGEAARQLVSAADTVLRDKERRWAAGEVAALDLSKLSLHEMKIREIEMQSKILQLERQAAEERRRLGELRRAGYHVTA